MLKELRTAFLITLIFTVITGLVYPLVITGIAQTVFTKAANGSLIEANGNVIGSALIGQSFVKPEYFHPRPSAAGPQGYDAGGSSGSNLGPTNPALEKRLQESAAAFRKENPSFTGPIPADAITTSASGLDPHISPANAQAQAARIAAARKMTSEQVSALVSRFTEERQLGILGEPRVNVLTINMALDNEAPVVK
ncbi:MAG: potassium-transporting ATPase subunit KdpC [Bryobacteraceae bacterium]